MDTFWGKILSLDTLINVVVFVFIGLMIWLYFKDEKKENRPNQ